MTDSVSENRNGSFEDDEGLEGVILSLASLKSLVDSNQTTQSLIGKRKQQNLMFFILSQLYILRKTLRLPYIHLQDKTADLETYADDIYRALRRSNVKVVCAPLYPMRDSVPVILASLAQQRSDLGPIDWNQVTTTQYAIMIGVALGNIGYYPDPRTASRNMINIGTALVRKSYTMTMPRPGYFCTYPHQQELPCATQQPKKHNEGRARICPQHQLNTDLRNYDCHNTESEDEGDSLENICSPCRQDIAGPASSSTNKSSPSTPTALASHGIESVNSQVTQLYAHQDKTATLS